MSNHPSHAIELRPPEFIDVLRLFELIDVIEHIMLEAEFLIERCGEDMAAQFHLVLCPLSNSVVDEFLYATSFPYQPKV